MDFITLAWTGIGLYFAAMIAIGLLGRADHDEGFIIGNRTIGLVPTAASIGAMFRDASFVWFWIAFSYLYGYAPLLLFIPFTAGILCLSRIAPRLRARAIEKNFITPGQMIGDSLGPVSQKATALFTVFLNVVFSAAQLYVIAQILTAIIDVQSYIIIPCVSAVIALYLFSGGYMNVIRTDYVQFFLIAALACIPFFLPIEKDVAFNVASFGSMGMQDTIGILVIATIGSIGNLDIWQRIFSARDDKAARWGPVLGAVFAFLATLGLVFIGLSSQTLFPEADPNTLFYKLFETQAVAPAILVFMLVAIFAMGMSSLDTHAYLFASTFLRDIAYTSVNEDRALYIRRARWLMLGMLALITVVAIAYQDLVKTLMGILSLWNIIVPMLLFSAFFDLPRSKFLDRGMAASLIAAFAVFLWGFLDGWIAKSFLYTAVPPMVSLALASAVAAAAVIRQRKSLIISNP